MMTHKWVSYDELWDMYNGWPRFPLKRLAAAMRGYTEISFVVLEPLPRLGL